MLRNSSTARAPTNLRLVATIAEEVAGTAAETIAETIAEAWVVLATGARTLGLAVWADSVQGLADSFPEWVSLSPGSEDSFPGLAAVSFPGLAAASSPGVAAASDAGSPPLGPGCVDLASDLAHP